ncbi:ribonuclease E inhibitor RraB [Puniceicoccales bacterium CK1056]|uniref:Ribonuclease E inhibitor RraB n=1 Tax=Oceanipulchritudo coccoides TaxID=2706888 RepID=A0A6B2LZ48_9BACT|nr:ribonuclease E inhibitor RraB [Oceanipulchritudo coccoides]NDV61918.1 ribonuclease E inhibitor RraB [Oceanipulchritudo coccoides]
MRKILTTVLIAMSIFSKIFGSSPESGIEIPNKVISIKQIEEMFVSMSKNPGWDMNGPLLWGYFFTNTTPEQLEKTMKILEERGYRFVEIFVSKKDNPDDPDLFWLHVEKVETHTPVTLDKRNDEFYILADELGLDSYDGMDVGPVEKE